MFLPTFKFVKSFSTGSSSLSFLRSERTDEDYHAEAMGVMALDGYSNSASIIKGDEFVGLIEFGYMEEVDVTYGRTQTTKNGLIVTSVIGYNATGNSGKMCNVKIITDKTHNETIEEGTHCFAVFENKIIIVTGTKQNKRDWRNGGKLVINIYDTAGYKWSGGRKANISKIKTIQLDVEACETAVTVDKNGLIYVLPDVSESILVFNQNLEKVGELEIDCACGEFYDILIIGDRLYVAGENTGIFKLKYDERTKTSIDFPIEVSVDVPDLVRRSEFKNEIISHSDNDDEEEEEEEDDEDDEMVSDQEEGFDPENLLIDGDDENVKHLYRTIIKSYPEEDLTRANEQENGPGFRNYKQFCKFQIHMLRLKIHNDHFDWILSKIRNSEIMLTDKESNVEFKMSGFYYNSCEEIVFFNER